MGLGSRGAHRGSEAASLRGLPSLPRKIWVLISNDRDLGSPRRPRLGSAATPPPRRYPGAGKRRPPGLGPRPSSRPPPRRPPGREPQWVGTFQPQAPYLPPEDKGWGRGVPSSSRSSAAGWVGREATPWGCLRLGPGLTGRDQWALLRGAARSLRAERRPREVLEESAACTVTAALIPGAGLERGRGEKGREQSGRGARGGERERADVGGAHIHARAQLSLARSPPSLGSSLSPAHSACPEPRSRPPGACFAREANLGRVHALPS